MNESYFSTILKNEPDVLTVAEAAKILRLGKNKTYALVNSGHISSIKIGQKFIIPKTAIIDFLITTLNSQINPD